MEQSAAGAEGISGSFRVAEIEAGFCRGFWVHQKLIVSYVDWVDQSLTLLPCSRKHFATQLGPWLSMACDLESPIAMQKGHEEKPYGS